MNRLAYLRAAKDGLVFQPQDQLSAQINSAANSISGYFDAIQSGIDDDLSVGQAVRGDKIEKVMKRALSTARLTGFQHAAKHSGKRMPALYGKDIQSKASKRAAKVNRLMTRTSKKRLRANPDSEYTLSKDRAVMASRYEIAKAYYKGVADGFRGTGFMKAWFTTSSNACADCEDNEGQGPIGMEEFFQSGDQFPTAHQNCQCGILVSKGKA